MFPGEAAMLMAIAVVRDSGKKLLPRPMDVVGGYIGYLYDSLLSRGYIKRDNSREYQLTSRGREALLEFLNTSKTSVKDTLKTLQPLGIEINVEVDNLEEEVVIKVVRKAKRSLSPSFIK